MIALKNVGTSSACEKKGRRTYLECISSHVFYKRARALYVSFNDLHRSSSFYEITKQHPLIATIFNIR